jgi:hypothetical protein
LWKKIHKIRKVRGKEDENKGTAMNYMEQERETWWEEKIFLIGL